MPWNTWTCFSCRRRNQITATICGWCKVSRDIARSCEISHYGPAAPPTLAGPEEPHDVQAMRPIEVVPQFEAEPVRGPAILTESATVSTGGTESPGTEHTLAEIDQGGVSPLNWFWPPEQSVLLFACGKALTFPPLRVPRASGY